MPMLKKSLLSGLKFEDVERPLIDPLTKARGMFENSLREQIEILNGSRTGRRWTFMIGGKSYIQLRFGNRPLDLGQGSAIRVRAPENYAETFELLLEALNRGEFDLALSKAAEANKRPRTRRGKSAR